MSNLDLWAQIHAADARIEALTAELARQKEIHDEVCRLAGKENAVLRTQLSMATARAQSFQKLLEERGANEHNGILCDFVDLFAYERHTALQLRKRLDVLERQMRADELAKDDLG